MTFAHVIVTRAAALADGATQGHLFGTREIRLAVAMETARPDGMPASVSVDRSVLPNERWHYRPRAADKRRNGCGAERSRRRPWATSAPFRHCGERHHSSQVSLAARRHRQGPWSGIGDQLPYRGGQAANKPHPATADELEKLAGLRDRGVITPAEFDQEKANVLRLGTGGSRASAQVCSAGHEGAAGTGDPGEQGR